MQQSDVHLRWVLQPIVDLAEPSLICAEALIRGKDASGHPVRSDQLIRAAEHNNRILTLDQWVILSVMQWIEDHLPYLGAVGFISINLSAKTLCCEHSLGLMINDVKGFDLPVRRLTCLEITETARIDDIGRAQEAIAQLNDLGLRVALDDYGSGFSTQQALEALDVDLVKLSAGLSGLLHENRADRLAQAVSFIHQHGALCVAEHIDTPAKVFAASRLGIRYLQGFYFSKPLAPSAFLAECQGDLQLASRRLCQ